MICNSTIVYTLFLLESILVSQVIAHNLNNSEHGKIEIEHK